KDALQKVHDETIAQVEKDKGLTTEQKDAQKTKAAEALKKGEEAVQSATTADEAIAKAEENKKIITVTHEKGDLAKVKDKAKEGLTATYNETVKNIKADSGLTADEQKKQLEGTEKAYKAGEQAITTAENADKVGEVLPVEKKKVSDEYKAGDLPKVKQAQKDALQKVHDETIAQVEKDKGLTTEQKDAQKAKAAEALKKGQDAVEAAPKADEAIKAGTDNQQPIKDSYIPGKLDDVQTKATADLKKAHTETVAKINGDDTLDKATKEAQVKEADKALAAGKDAITEADDADKVSTAVTEHTPKIKAAHKTGDLKKAQEEANTALDKAAEKEREEINNDITLTAKDKEQQLKEVETALTKAKDNVKAAKTADAINDARDKGIATIDAVHKAGQDLGARKSGQVAKLEEAAKETKDKISADPTLTSKEKEEQSKAVDAELKKAIEAVNAADTADKVDDALGKGVTDIKNQHKTGDPVVARREAHGKQLDRVAQETKDGIEKDPTLTTEEKAKQVKDVDAAKERGMAKLTEAKNADELDKAYGEGVTDIKNQHKSGDPIEARRGLHNKSIDEVAQATKDAITADTTLTEAEKETQRGNVDKEATKAKEELAKAKDADALDKAYGDGVTSIKNQHKSGKGLDVRKDEHKKALEAVAKRVTAEIEADPTLTPEVREQQKAEVQKELELATDKIAEAKDADEADKAYGDGVTAIENAHVIGKGIEARKDLAKKDLAEAVAKTKALIIEDKTLTDDQRKEQLSGVDTEYAKGIENIAAAKDAAGVDKAYSDGVRDILAQYKEGQNLNDRRNAAKEFLLKEADKVTKLINDDPTLTHDQKVDQINKVEQAKLDAIKSVDDAQTADAINDALGKGIENINNQYQHGDGVDVRKVTAKGNLEKEAAKVKALIAKDPTLTQADKDKQTAAVDAAKNTAIAAVDKATTAEGINRELGKGITAINKAYRPGEGVKARKEAAKADLEKEAAKVKALIAKDPTLTQADKDKQTAAVDAAKNTAIAAVDKATTAEGINQELGKGITAINKAYRPGEGVKARKEAAKANLEKEAAKVKALITNDPTLTKADKAKQTEAVAKALKAAIAAVDKATTAEGINRELGKGITAINKAYRPGEGVKARKEAAKANLEKVAKETKALISGDRYLSETEKAVQKQAVEQAFAKALGQVETAKTVEAVKLAENLGTVAIRSAYVAGLAKDTDQATAALNEAKQAAIEALKQAAAETLAKITTDAKLTEAQKAEQSENVSLALKTAIATVRSAQSIASVKEAKAKGIAAIRAAYVPNKAVAKSSSANHLPKSGDANSIVLVGLGVISLLLGMVLYSKKKESKD
ncbi:LPXTG cell wall anchor domain-containing protein, partial [Streptococcus pyogenes]